MVPFSVFVGLVLVTALAPGAVAAAADHLCDTCTCNGVVLNCTSALVRKLPEDPAAWPTDIEVAVFEHNELVLIGKIPTLPRLRHLNLRHNNIQVIEKDAFANLTALKELDLGSNELTRSALSPHIFRGPYLETEYLPLANLSVLRLDSNAIHSLGSDIFEHVTHLRVLSLAFNPIRVIDTPTLQAISSLAHLEVLDLSHVGVSTLPAYLLNTPINLTTLNISANQFTTVPEELKHAHQLKELVLSSNPIRALEKGSFPASLRTLEVLEMDYMHNLSHVGAGGLAPLKGLRALRILHSLQLTEIHGEAFVGAHETLDNATFPPLRELILRGNSLQKLDSQMILRWFDLEVVDLEDNMWECDCENTWMLETLEPVINRTNPKLLNNFICANPEPMRGASMFALHLRHYHMRCLDADGAHPERDGLVLVGALVGVLLAVPATLAAFLCWRRAGFAFFSGGPAAYSRAFYRRTNDMDDF